ncbi:MAG: DUF4382 domain-containing protein [Candidatus Electrothrix sp. GW3-4]|uniref:DUF4382 domain-containing protein n=1 Tax=Candidatus Electrothrix sp. GW3-4 TaxID=3126740 RepID=UPI0030D15819
MLLSLAFPLGNVWAKQSKFNIDAVSDVTLDVVRFEACIDDTDECVIAGGPKQVNLLDLADGRVDFAKQVLLPDNTTELRLVLGESSTITVDDESLPLDVPSGQTSGLKLKGEDVFPLEGGLLAGMSLDFDLGKALVVRGKKSGSSYKLKPVIKVATAEITPMTDGTAAVLAMPDEDSEITIGEKFSLFIPAGAVSAPMVISVKETKFTVEVWDEETGEVVEKPALSSSYELNPDGAEFAVPLEITIPYYPDMLLDEVSEEELAVYLDGEKIPTDIDTVSKLAVADVWHFSVAKLSDGRIAFETQMPVNDFDPDMFGYRFMTYESPYATIYHPGVDLNVTTTSSSSGKDDSSRTVPVFAIADGTIVAKEDNWTGIVIRHSPVNGKTYYSQYGHIIQLTGDEELNGNGTEEVKRGRKIGYIGDVGQPGSFHLHFGIRNNFHFNPKTTDEWTTNDFKDLLKDRKKIFREYESL